MGFGILNKLLIKYFLCLCVIESEFYGKLMYIEVMFIIIVLIDTERPLSFISCVVLSGI